MSLNLNEHIIYVLTAGRTKKFSTLVNLPASLLTKGKVHIVCPENERTIYHKYGETVSVGQKPQGVAHARQIATQHAFENHSKKKYLWLLDDDLTFYKRKTKDVWNLKVLEGDEFLEPMEIFAEYLKNPNFVQAAFSSRPGNNRNEVGWELNSRAIQATCLDLQFFKKFPVEEFWSQDFDCMEDFHLILWYLTQGYSNITNYMYACGQPSSNLPGGCSTFRTPDHQAKVARRLEEKFPQFVKVVEKESKNWKGFGGTRIDVRVQWKKAYASNKRLGALSHEIMEQLAGDTKHYVD